jgi:hypothetical protein
LVSLIFFVETIDSRRRSKQEHPYDMSMSWVDGDDDADDPAGARAFRQQRIARYLLSGGQDQTGGWVAPMLVAGRMWDYRR